MLFSWVLFAYVWSGGWVLTVLSFSALMKISAKDGEMRRETALLRSSWASPDRRVRMALSLLLSWPFIVLLWPFVLLFRLFTWMDQKSRQTTEQDSADPVRE